MKNTNSIIPDWMMFGVLVQRIVARETPTAASSVRQLKGQEARKVIRARLRSGVQIDGSPRLGKRVVSITVKKRAASVK